MPMVVEEIAIKAGPVRGVGQLGDHPGLHVQGDPASKRALPLDPGRLALVKIIAEYLRLSYP